MGLPWPTTFSAAVQSIHWRHAEAAAKEMLEQIGQSIWAWKQAWSPWGSTKCKRFAIEWFGCVFRGKFIPCSTTLDQPPKKQPPISVMGRLRPLPDTWFSGRVCIYDFCRVEWVIDNFTAASVICYSSPVALGCLGWREGHWRKCIGCVWCTWAPLMTCIHTKRSDRRQKKIRRELWTVSRFRVICLTCLVTQRRMSSAKSYWSWSDSSIKLMPPRLDQASSVIGNFDRRDGWSKTFLEICSSRPR